MPAAASIFDFTREDLHTTLEPAFRATQLFEAVYRHGIEDAGAVTNLPLALRRDLADRFDLTVPPIEQTFEARDGTRRHLIRLPDGELAETVFIPAGGRNTFCLSSQVGCALACEFCLTGKLGFTRHLTAGEIVSQLMAARRHDIADPRLHDHFNVVLMGMGEPLHNYQNVMRALRIMADPAGLGMSMSRITLSTVGLVPEIDRLATEPLVPNLAVSLTGATDTLRDRLMPINRTYPIAELAACLQRFPRPGRRRLTLEYVLLDGLTDTPEEARALARLARTSGASVNLIPLNEAPDLPFRRPPEARILAFQAVLRKRNVPAFIRRSRGDDISAACGQLRKLRTTAPGIDLGALGIERHGRSQYITGQ